MRPAVKPISVLLFMILLVSAAASPLLAAEQETELFNKGYEYLFSYKPDKAAETFRQFLKEYPGSSARDAAMFWLGKTLISLRAYDEAAAMFEALKREFPESPYILFLDIEAEEISRSRSTKNNKPADVPPAEVKPDIDRQPSPQHENRVRELEKRLAEVSAELEKTKSALSDENKRLLDQQAKTASFEALSRKEKAETETLTTRSVELEKRMQAMLDEKSALAAEVSRLEAERQKLTAERDALVKRTEAAKKTSSSDVTGPFNRRIEDLEKSLKTLSAEKDGLAAELSRAAEERKQAESERDELVSRSKSLEQKLSVDTTAPLKKRIGELEARSNALESELLGIRKEREGLIRTAEEEKRASAEMRTLIDKLQNEEKTSRDSAEKSTEQQISMQAKLDASRKDRLRIEAQMKDLKTQSEKLEAVNRELIGQVSALRSRTDEIAKEKTSDIETREVLLKKRANEIETLNSRINTLEKNIKAASDEKNRLSSDLAKAAGEKKQAETERDEIIRKSKLREETLLSDTAAPLNRKIKDLESRYSSIESELAAARKESVLLTKTVEDEKKISSELKSALNKLRASETDLKASAKTRSEEYASEMTKMAGLESENRRLVSEVLKTREESEKLADANRELTSKIADMEDQAQQRVRDMKILNSYLSKLMFKNRQEPEGKIKETAVVQPSPSSSIKVGNRDVAMDELIRYSTSSALALHKTGIGTAFWREGDPVNDFLNEDLLFKVASGSRITLNENSMKDLVRRQGLTDAEADYLRRAALIAALINAKYKGGSEEPSIEILAVDYKPGNANAKTVLATDLQKAARSGRSFKDIRQAYADSVNYSSLTLKEFSAKYKEKSQIIQKLDFLKNETVVMWSERGYMLIRPVVPDKAVDPLSVLLPEKRDGLSAFSKEYIMSLKK